MDAKNNTNFAQNPQGNSASIQIYNDAEHQQFGKKAYNTTRFFKQLSNNAKTVHYDLCDLLLGQSFRTVPLTDERLAERTGLKLYQVSRVRRELADSLLVDVHPMISKSGKRQVGTYVYSFNSTEEITGEKLQKVSPESAKNCQQNVTESVSKMLQKVSHVSEKETDSKPDVDSVSEDQAFGSPEGTTKTITTTTTTNSQVDLINQVEEMLENDIEKELQRLQQTYWPAPDKNRMRGTLADLLNQIAQEFSFPSNYAFKLLEEVSRDKGGIKFPQGFSTQVGMEHLARKAKPLKREIKKQEKLEQEEHQRKLREKTERQRKLELEHRESVFQSLDSQFDQDLQNSIKEAITDSSVYYDYSGKEKLLESKIDAFLSDQETMQPLYNKYIGTELDSDDVIKREEARIAHWAIGIAGTRLGDFCDFTKRKILSDDQLQSLFTLDDDSKPQPPDNVLTRAEQQPAKPFASNRTKAKCYTPREKLPPIDAEQSDSFLEEQKLRRQAIIREGTTHIDDFGSWSLRSYRNITEAGMTSDELFKIVTSQTGDEPLPKLAEVSQDQEPIGKIAG